MSAGIREPKSELTYTLRQIAALLGVSYMTARSMHKAGALPGCIRRVRGHALFIRAIIDRWLAGEAVARD
jgi:excisionase family DNA binding protein